MTASKTGVETEQTREIFYYFRDKENKPIITVCLLVAGETITRGIAICSNKDIPCKAVGRNISKQRAWHAFLWNESGLPILRSDAANIAFEITHTDPSTEIGDFKMDDNPRLTDFENRLLHGEKTNEMSILQ